MFCEKCGKQISDDSTFCEYCGWQVVPAEDVKAAPDVIPSEGPDAKGAKPSPLSGKERLVIIVAVAAAIVIAAGVFVINGPSGQYKEKLQQGDQYLTDAEFNVDAAETAYLEAIEIEPKEPEGYHKLADLYVRMSKYEEAEDILNKAEEAGCGGSLETDIKTVTTYTSLQKYVSSGKAGDWAGAESETTECSGLVSAFIRDLDGESSPGLDAEGIPSLVTVTADYDGEYTESEEGMLRLWGQRGLILTIRIYSYADDKVTLTQEKTIDCGGYAEAQMGWSKFDLFMKQVESGANYLMVTMHGANVDDSFEAVTAINISEEGIAEPLEAVVVLGQGMNFWLNGELEIIYDPYEYSDDPSQMRPNLVKALEEAKTKYDEEMKQWGLGGMFRDAQRDGGWESLEVIGYDENDPTESCLAYIGMGCVSDKDSEPWGTQYDGDHFFIKPWTL